MTPRELVGPLEGKGLRIGIVVSRFNRTVTGPLLSGALEGLAAHGVAEADVVVVHVPGAFEVPFAARRLAASGRFAALICLGAVIRGETPHFEYIAAEVTRGIGEIIADHGLPVAFGVLTTDTIEQAFARAGEGHGNKGYEAAITAIEMATLAKQLDVKRS
jgi:6,7-dimethyl-8-ribityllumazine synthase